MFTLKSENKNKQAIIAQGLSLYKQTFWQAIPYSLCGAIFMLAPIFCDIWAQAGYLLWSLTICWLCGLIFLSGLIYRLYCIYYNIPTTFSQSIRHALLKLIPILLLGALYSMVILSGTMLLILPGIILTISLLFSFILVLTSNQNILQTLTTSHRLVWGHWWHTALVIGSPILLNIAISLTVFVGFIGLLAICGAEFHMIYAMAFLSNILVQALLLPLIINIALALLHDLRNRWVPFP